MHLNYYIVILFIFFSISLCTLELECVVALVFRLCRLFLHNMLIDTTDAHWVIDRSYFHNIITKNVL